MKKLILFIVVSLFTIPALFSAKPIIPPGTVRINDSLFIDKNEVRNVDYIEFLYWTEKEYGRDSQEYLFILPDTTVWETKHTYGEPMKNIYFRHPAYNNYPLVGISFEQAIMYCDWRTDRVNEILHIKINKISYDSLKNIADIPKYVEYRLPTIEEWEYVANQPYSEKTLKRMNKKKHKGIKRTNLNNNDVGALPSDNTSITAPVSSYWPNQLGVFNIIGNAAELTSKEGVAKGGSWSHRPEEVSVEAIFKYEKPESWLGFRCVCDMHIQI